MGKIIVGYYGKLWMKDEGLATDEEMEDYVCEGLPVIPSALRPKAPTRDDFIDAINDTNDSCPGPDGIPFSDYRAYLQTDLGIAATLCGVATVMGLGVLPPRPYNEARLFLLPKK